MSTEEKSTAHDQSFVKAAGHIHAEFMAQYAKDAAMTSQPWLLWQVWSATMTRWITLNGEFYFKADMKYRRKTAWHEGMPAEGIFCRVSGGDFTTIRVIVDVHKSVSSEGEVFEYQDTDGKCWTSAVPMIEHDVEKRIYLEWK